MLLDPQRFSFIPPLEAGFETIRAECAALGRDAYIEWPDRGAYQGTWLGFPLFFHTYPKGLDALFDPNQARCPATTRLLRSIPRVVSAGFSWMEPGCHILPHTDLKPANLLRTHLPLTVPDGALMRVGEDRHTWEEGRCIVFDGAIEHETGNLGNAPRIVLLVDAFLDDEEFDYLRSTGTANRARDQAPLEGT